MLVLVGVIRVVSVNLVLVLSVRLLFLYSFNPILPGGGGRIPPSLMFFFHHPETAQAMKLKLSDFKDTCLRHILQVIPGCYILRCYHGNKITKGTLQNLTQ